MNLRRLATVLAFVTLTALSGCSDDPPAGPTGPGGTCSYTVAGAPGAPIPAAAAEFALQVTAPAGCSWTAASSAPFISTVGTAAGSGNGTARFAAQANTGAARQGSIQVAGQTFMVNQEAGTPETCDIAVSPASSSVGTTGGDVSVGITINSGTNCSWTAAANDAFITVKSGAEGSGPGTVVLTVEANSGGARTGTAVIAGRTVTIEQEGVVAPACLFSVSPTQLTAALAGETRTVTITVTQGTSCAWIAQSQASFVTVSGAGSGVGNGSVTLSIEANTGGARSGIVVVAGHAVTVSQFAAPSGAVAVLRLQSEPGDPVGGGQTSVFTYSSTQFTARLDVGRPGLEFLTTTGAFWHANFAAPSGQALAPGLYDRAYRYPFQHASQPGLSVGGGTGCNKLTGRFLINQAVFAGNTVQRFHAKFQQHCDGWSVSLRGELWIDVQGSQTPPPMPDLPAPSSPSTFLSYQSDPGDPVGQGQSASFTLSSRKFVAWQNDSRPAVNIHLQTPIDSGLGGWIVDFMAPSGTQLLPGTYLNATRYPFNAPGVPGLSVSGNGIGCNMLTGQFTVLEASYGPSGEVYRFRATFEQHCDGITPALRGEIYIVADPWR